MNDSIIAHTNVMALDINNINNKLLRVEDDDNYINYKYVEEKNLHVAIINLSMVDLVKTIIVSGIKEISFV